MKRSIKSSVVKAGLLAGVAAIGMSAAWAAQAQDAASQTSGQTGGQTAGQTTTQNGTALAPIVIQGDGEKGGKGPVKGYVAKTSASATKTGTPILETQQSVSVVTKDQMDAQGVTNVGEALDYSAGVVGEPYGSDGRFDSPRIRGFDGAQSEYLNGLKIMRTSGAPAIEPYGLERIEVLKGPASVLYGQGNPGGLIDMISKHPQFDNPTNEAGFVFGSYDTYGAFFDIGGPVKQGSDFAYRLTGLARNAGQQTDDLQNDRYFIAPALTWQPDEDTTITLLASVQHDNPDAPSGLPSSMLSGSNSLSRDFSIGDKDFDSSNRTLTNIGYEVEHKLNDVWTFRQNMRYSHFKWDFDSLYYSGLEADGITLDRGATYQRENLNTWNLDTSMQAEFDTGEVEHKAIVGLDLRYFNNSTLTEFGYAPSLSSTDPVRGVSIPKDVWYTQDVNTNLWQAGVYAQDEISYDKWRATLGLRHDWSGTTGDQYTNFLGSGATSSLDQNDHKLTGRVGLSYLFDNGIAPYASYATSFEPTAGANAAGDPLRPTTGEQYEVGVKYQPTGFNGFFSAAAYDLKQKNVLTTTTLPGGATTSDQIGEVHVKGIELEGVVSLAQGLNLRAAYTYMDPEIVGGDNDGNMPANTPKNMASLWLDYTLQEDTLVPGLGFGGGVRYVGQRYGLDANADSNDLRSNTLFDAAIHYTRDNIKASLNFQNIADKKYVSNCGSFGCYYGDGRTVMGKLTFSW
ncbi:TonB-dependent siderophore receptor [Neorhizobium sp. NCHU2750]|uniref:TonB-dependent siderophore receptor n=1 Tax=Neorhizobium sp. NCHU2750 TaxID=1825976 RepID=UPI000EB6ABBD|nr:iron complex outermembrane recepter protein [Neorhizobium sp. NCHU2750]